MIRGLLPFIEELPQNAQDVKVIFIFNDQCTKILGPKISFYPKHITNSTAKIYKEAMCGPETHWMLCLLYIWNKTRFWTLILWHGTSIFRCKYYYTKADVRQVTLPLVPTYQLQSAFCLHNGIASSLTQNAAESQLQVMGVTSGWG